MEVCNAEDEEGVFSGVQAREVTLLGSSGRPLMQVATEVGISPSMLRNWRSVIRPDADGTRRAKKSDQHLRGGAEMSFNFIHDHAADGRTG
jgi:hypothetical protein